MVGGIFKPDVLFASPNGVLEEACVTLYVLDSWCYLKPINQTLGSGLRALVPGIGVRQPYR